MQGWAKAAHCVDAVWTRRIRSAGVAEADIERVAERFFEAVRRGETRDAVALVWPALEPVVRAAIARHRSLLARSGTEADDVVQHVALSLLRRPPANVDGQPAWMVLKAWSRTVTVRHLVDRARRRRPSTDAELNEPVPLAARLEARERVRRLLACAERLSPRYAEVFRMVLADPDIGALDLAEALGIDPPDPSLDEHERARRARQSAWAARSRTLRWLADCMREGER